MPTTDLTTVVLPLWAAPSHPHRVRIGDHAIAIREQWWREAVTARRLDSIAADVPRAGKLLTEAADRSRHDLAGAYAVPWPDNRSAIRSLGPSFFTSSPTSREPAPQSIRA